MWQPTLVSSCCSRRPGGFIGYGVERERRNRSAKILISTCNWIDPLFVLLWDSQADGTGSKLFNYFIMYFCILGFSANVLDIAFSTVLLPCRALSNWPRHCSVSIMWWGEKRFVGLCKFSYAYTTDVVQRRSLTQCNLGAQASDFSHNAPSLLHAQAGDLAVGV